MQAQCSSVTFKVALLYISSYLVVFSWFTEHVWCVYCICRTASDILIVWFSLHILQCFIFFFSCSTEDHSWLSSFFDYTELLSMFISFVYSCVCQKCTAFTHISIFIVLSELSVLCLFKFVCTSKLVYAWFVIGFT